jgi:hypothetical protein
MLDTSVVLDFDVIEEDVLPDACSIATLTLAELSAGLHSVTDSVQRAARQERFAIFRKHVPISAI